MPKRYRVEIARSAERDAPVRAAQWFAEFERQIRTLSQLPKRCPVIPEADDIGVEYRHLVSGTYRTIFRIGGSTVWVVRVVHVAQLLDTSMLEKHD